MGDESLNILFEPGIAVALAWPNTYCKQAGGWYDHFLKWIGINKGHYYQAGHAALLLLSRDGRTAYYDFGRYHSPHGFGRVRGANTDPDLTLYTGAEWNSNGLSNLDEILLEVSAKSACHGQGPLYAGCFDVNILQANSVVRTMQSNSPIRYGPFVYQGTNCSRFVHAVIRNSVVDGRVKALLSLPYTVSPSPMFNVRMGKNKVMVPEVFSSYRPKSVNLKGVLSQAVRPGNLSDHAVWHAGEGGGSWFEVELVTAGQLSISRYTPSGELEFSSVFIDESCFFSQYEPFHIGHLSHFESVTLVQGSQSWKVFRK